MNILILSCGTRNKLIYFFKEDKNFDKVIATDCSHLAPALYVADSYYIVPRMNQPGYMDCLMDICTKENIDLILPLHEDELLLIAQNKQLFIEKGIIPIVSDYEKVSLCRDKYMLNNTLLKYGVSAIPTFLGEEYLQQNTEDNEVILKPRYGAGSVSTFRVSSRKLLETLIQEIKEEFVVQPFIKGKEFGVDVYVDMVSHEVISCFCKEKLRMRAGETEKSLSVIHPEIEKLVTEAVTRLGLYGPIDVDVMEQDGVYYILEINPRFGGGYPHAYMCGVSFPEYIARNGRQEVNPINMHNYIENSIALKYSDVFIVNEEKKV